GIEWLNEGISYTVDLFSDLATWGKRNEDILLALGGAVLAGVVAYKAYNAWQVVKYAWMMKDVIATTLLTTLKGSLTVATGALTIATTALNAAFLASPVGWVVAGIGALVGGVIYAWK